MTEELLHFIWKFRLLRPVSLCTTGNLPLEIHHPGTHNSNAGPDFTNGRIRLNGTEWAGNIELHKRSSEWDLHNHQYDTAYNNVILHVVYEHDKEVFNEQKQPIPCLELRKYLPTGILSQYDTLYKNKQEIPCGNGFTQANSVVFSLWMERMLTERLEEKTAFIRGIYNQTGNNWEETFYLLLSKNYGFKVNDEAFLQLARQTPLSLLLRNAPNLLQTEALLFGRAGMLENEFEEEYPNKLKKEYHYLSHKYKLPKAFYPQWKFMRMRPGNFPTLRIAQLAAFLQKYQHVFSKLLELNTTKELEALFDTETSGYWETHYSFTSVSPPGNKKMGSASIENILINTVCPLLFFYGKERNKESLCQRAIDWMGELEAEDNKIARLYRKLGFKAKHAGHSQALIQLNRNYCSHKKCLQCGIGTQLLKETVIN